MSDAVQLIKDKADIVELISEIIPVKRAGSSYLALCPFHNDSKPSMHISSSKGIYKCFACGAGGDVFKFWSEYYQKDFPETLKDLATKYGVELPEYNKEKSEEKNLFVNLHNMAAEFYHQKLLLDQKAFKAREYLKARGLSTEIIAKFKLGFASSDKNEPQLLIKHLKGKIERLTDQILLNAGLAYRKDDGEVVDRFRNRLMIPVMDERSRCIAFGARTLDENFGPKYINSPETEIYIKGNNLYGLDHAKESIRKKDAAILVEGFFDVISLNQVGFENIVANQGTALTANQIKKLAKFSHSKKIYLCFDTDAAGEKATDAAAEVVNQTLAEADFELRVIRVPGGKDPDEFIKEHSITEFEKIVEQAPYYIDYKIEQELKICNLKDSFAKEKSAKKINIWLSQIKKEIVRFDYIKKVAEKLNLPERYFQTTASNNDNPYESSEPKLSVKQKIEAKQEKKENNSIQNIEIELITLFLRDKKYLELFLEENRSTHSLEAKELINLLVDIIFENPDLTDPNYRFDLLLAKSQAEQKYARLVADIGFCLEQELVTNFPDEIYNQLIKRLADYENKLSEANFKLEMKKHPVGSPEWHAARERKLEHTRKKQGIAL